MAILLSAPEGGHLWDLPRLDQDKLTLRRTVHLRFECEPLCLTDGTPITAVLRHRFAINVG